MSSELEPCRLFLFLVPGKFFLSLTLVQDLCTNDAAFSCELAAAAAAARARTLGYVKSDAAAVKPSSTCRQCCRRCLNTPTRPETYSDYCCTAAHSAKFSGQH